MYSSLVHNVSQRRMMWLTYILCTDFHLTELCRMVQWYTAAEKRLQTQLVQNTHCTHIHPLHHRHYHVTRPNTSRDKTAPIPFLPFCKQLRLNILQTVVSFFPHINGFRESHQSRLGKNICTMNLIPSIVTASAQVLLISYNESFDREMQTELKFVKQLATGLEYGARGDPVVNHSLKSFPFQRKAEHPSLLLYLYLYLHMYVYLQCPRFKKAEAVLLAMLTSKVLAATSWRPSLLATAHRWSHFTNHRIHPIRHREGGTLKNLSSAEELTSVRRILPSLPPLQYFNASVSPTQHPLPIHFSFGN